MSRAPHDTLGGDARGQRAVRRILASLTQDTQAWVAVLLIAGAIGLFVAFPLGRVVLTPQLEEWSRLLARDRWVTALRNTMLITLLSTLSATVLGFIYAYAIERVRITGSRVLTVLAILPLLSPPFLGAIAIIMLLGRQGLITNQLLGVDFQLYGLNGLWIVQTLGFFPIAFLTIRGVLRAVSVNLEHAARDLGASRWYIFRTIVFPLSLPGVVSAALLVAIFVLGDFASPMILGGRFRVLATEAYTQVVGWADLRMGAALATVLFVPTAIFFVLQRLILRRGSYVTVTGRAGSEIGPVPQHWLVRAFLQLICWSLAGVILSIYAMIVYGSFTTLWGVDFSLSFDNFRLASAYTRDIVNSISFAAYAGVATAFLAVFAAYIIHRKAFPGRNILDISVLLPAAIPGTLLGIAYILAFNTPPFLLTGTAFIVVASMVFRSLPVGYRSAVSGFSQIDPSLEESATDLGAGLFKRFFTIMLPLLAPAFTAALVFTFVDSINTLSAVIFLVTPRTSLATVRVLNLVEYGEWGQAAALTLLLLLFVFLTLAAFALIFGRRGGIKLFDL